MNYKLCVALQTSFVRQVSVSKKVPTMIDTVFGISSFKLFVGKKKRQQTNKISMSTLDGEENFL